MTKNTSVIGIYPDRETVSDAIGVLQKGGYRPTDISVLASENAGSKDFAHEQHTKALAGAAIGGGVGILTGAAAAVAIAMWAPAGGVFAALQQAGPVLAGFAGGGAAGGLGWLVGMVGGSRQPEYIARRYRGRIRRGGILMSVHCDSPEWCDRAKKTLRDTGARNISAMAEAAADFGTADRPTERAPVAAPAPVPVIRDPVPVIQDKENG